MSARTTEALHLEAEALDTRPMGEVALLLAESQISASSSVRAAIPGICAGAVAMAGTLRGGARLHYIAAGSSGLMAAADAQELGGTFSIPPEQLQLHMAGGLPTGVDMPGDTEDDTDSLNTALRDISGGDTVIAVSASGTTPYTLTGAEIARAKGATIVAIANNPDAPLLSLADHQILLETPPEVLSGSTRMGAGTAQKIALNMLSTLMAVELGHVFDGMMVNLRADNAKLQSRAVGIVARIADVPTDVAHTALDDANGHVKNAVLIALGASSDDARALLDQSAGRLRPALASFSRE